MNIVVYCWFSTWKTCRQSVSMSSLFVDMLTHSSWCSQKAEALLRSYFHCKSDRMQHKSQLYHSPRGQQVAFSWKCWLAFFMCKNDSVNMGLLPKLAQSLCPLFFFKQMIWELCHISHMFKHRTLVLKKRTVNYFGVILLKCPYRKEDQCEGEGFGER